jgi:hypothetical protein
MSASLFLKHFRRKERIHMRELSITTYDIESFFEREFARPEVVEATNVLRNQVVINPNFRGRETKFRFKGWSRKELLLLYLCCLIQPSDILWYARLDIESETRKLCSSDRVIFEYLKDVRSFNELLLFLRDTNEWSSRSFFGWFKQQLPIVLRKFISCIYYQEPAKVNQPQRKRGYNDKGSRTLPHNNRSIGSDYTLIELQQRIELERKVPQDTADFLRGMFMG